MTLWSTWPDGLDPIGDLVLGSNDDHVPHAFRTTPIGFPSHGGCGLSAWSTGGENTLDSTPGEPDLPATIGGSPMAPDDELPEDSVAITRLADGRGVSGEELAPIVYEDLRRLAEHFFQRERAGITIQPTALVHEAYLRLADQ